MHQQRVVITGLGVLAPNGCGKEPFWQACLQGRSGVRTITRFDASELPTRIAGEISDFSARAFHLTELECGTLDRSTQFAVAAANLAMEDAGIAGSSLSEEDRAHMGVYLGTAMATADKGEKLWLQFAEYDGSLRLAHLAGLELADKHEQATLIASTVPSAAIASHLGLSGPCLTLSTGCSSGADAIGQAFWQIQQGHVRRMLAGGSDSALTPLGLSAFSVIHALSTRNEQPEQASRPYDAQRDGFVLSEGAAVLLLEERELALARGVHIYAEIVDFVSNSNAYHMTSLPSDGAPLQALLQQIMQQTALTPRQIGYINSHGSSTLSNDIAETIAYKGVFGTQAYDIPISSTKSLIGHTQGAASAIETVVTALAIDQQILPPTINLEQPDPACDLDYVPGTARPVSPDRPLQFALTHSSGFGGVNTALMLAKHEISSQAALTHLQDTNTPMYHLRKAKDRGGSGVDAASKARRVVITGLGVVAPNGIGKEAFWQSVREGRRSFEPLRSWSDEDSQPRFVGKVVDFHREDYVGRKLALRTDRMTHFAFAAVQEALQDARLTLDAEDPRRVGAVISNTLGGIEYVTQQVEQFHKRGPRFLSAYTTIAWLHVANVGQISVRYGLQGYCKTPVNGTCGGLNALGMAYDAIKRGVADILIAGGSEAPLHPYALHELVSGQLFSKESDPAAYRPFDLRANGLLAAEGAGICILEDLEHALKRNAPIYGELLGYAQTCAPQNRENPGSPEMAAYTRALQFALEQANLTPEEIACVYLDGRASPFWDIIETNALKEVFRASFETLACSVPRTQFGHSLASAGALDTICALLALGEGIIPPTLNCEQPDPRSCPPGLSRLGARAQDPRLTSALVCGRAFGGSHVVLAVKK